MHARLVRVSNDPVERAHHISRSIVGVDAAAAATVAAGAEEAANRGDHAGAAALYLRAVDLGSEDAPACEWALRAAAALSVAGDVETAGSIARSLVARLPAGALRARARHLLVVNQDGPGMSYENGRAELDAALVDAVGDPALQATLRVEMSSLACGLCLLDEAVAHARDAIELAEAVGDGRVAVAALGSLGFAESMLGHGVPDSARRAFERWDGALGSSNSPRMELACCCMHATQFEEAAALFEQEVVAAEELGVEPVEVVARAHLAEVQLRAGQWADAHVNAWLALEHARQAADPQIIGAISCITGMAEALLGAHEEARSLAAIRLATAEETADFWWTIGGRAVLGFVAFTEDDAPAAVAALEPAWRLMLERGLGETNAGGTATAALSVSLSGSSAFTKIADTCSASSLGPAKRCTITVRYRPTAAALATATLTATSLKPAATASVKLTGTGGYVDVEISPSTYDFGSASGSQAFVATNNGNISTAIYSFGAPADEHFGLGGANTCMGSALVPGGSCSFTIAFTPPTCAAEPALYQDSASIGGYASVTIKGEQPLCLPHLTLAAYDPPGNSGLNGWSFDGDSGTQVFSLTNDGKATTGNLSFAFGGQAPDEDPGSMAVGQLRQLSERDHARGRRVVHVHRHLGRRRPLALRALPERVRGGHRRDLRDGRGLRGRLAYLSGRG